MNEDENSFDALRQLLTLKRQETPPPGYFNNFSVQIIDCIRSTENSKSQSASTASDSETPWFSKFLQLFEFKPAFAGALASAVCLLLIFGIVYADRPDAGTQPFLQGTGSSLASLANMPSASMPTATYAADTISSNNPTTSLQPMAPLFDSGKALVEPVSFSTSGN